MATPTTLLDWDEFPTDQTFHTLWKLSTKEEIVGDPNNAESTGMLEEMIASRQRIEEEERTLRRILGHIRSLCAYNAGARNDWGDEYRQFDPYQPIYRRKQGQEVVSNGQGVWTFKGLALKRLDVPIPPAEKNYWTLSDLLGLFFSNLGPAPGGASRLNFYLPLIALYTRWVYILIPQDGPPLQKPPSTYAIMWAEPKLSDKKTPRNIYLGSTPGGIEGKALQKTNRVARFKLLAQVDVPDLHAAQFEVSVKGESEPKLVEWAFQNHIEPWVFGNCAETYSYLQLLLSLKRQGKTRPATPNGFAMRPNSPELKQIESTDVYDENVILRAGDPTAKPGKGPQDFENLMNPCRNCAHVIRTLESSDVVDNFQTHQKMGFGEARARPRGP